jgi:hypothetical protein
MEKNMKPLDANILKFYKDKPEMLAARKLIFAECVEGIIKKARKVITPVTGNYGKDSTLQVAEWARVMDKPFNSEELEQYNIWLKRFDTMYSYGMLPDIEDVVAKYA